MRRRRSFTVGGREFRDWTKVYNSAITEDSTAIKNIYNNKLSKVVCFYKQSADLRLNINSFFDLLEFLYF
jgi:hypothetical protein